MGAVIFFAVLMITFYLTRGNRSVVSSMVFDSHQEGNMQYLTTFNAILRGKFMSSSNSRRGALEPIGSQTQDSLTDA